MPRTVQEWVHKLTLNERESIEFLEDIQSKPEPCAFDKLSDNEARRVIKIMRKKNNGR
jgi:hypothetical protein